MQSQSEPLVSVVIPCYNHAQFVQDCIQSVIDQTYANIELIIIDDGSKDQSVEKIEEMLDKCRSRFSRFEFRHRPNKGLSETLNEALEWCQGEYFSAIASDDMMLKEKTQIQIDAFKKNKKVLGVFGNFILINNHGNEIKSKKIAQNVYTFKDVYEQNHFLPAPTQMLKLESVRNIGGFKAGILIEDWYIYLKMLESGGEMLLLKEDLSFYRHHENNMSGNFKKMTLGRFQVINHFLSNEYTEKVFIKQCWDNAFYTLRLDFFKSICIMFKSIINILFR